MNVAGLD